MKTLIMICEYFKKRNVSYLSVIFLIILMVSNAFAAPSINKLTELIDSVSGFSNISLSGIAFGTKAQPAPVYWNNMDNEVSGSSIPGWTISSKPGGIVSTVDKWSGGKSLYFAMKQANASPGWNQILRDMGVSTRWYFHFKVRLNKNDSNTRFQWKSWRISSSSDGYAWNADDSTTVMMNDFWWEATQGWYNTAIGPSYNNAGSPASGGTGFNTSSALVLNQWQTLEEYITMSSAPLAADGIAYLWRDGNLVSSKTNNVTHDAGSGQWRYMLLGQGTGTGILPVGGQEAARWWPRELPAGGQQNCPR